MEWTLLEKERPPHDKPVVLLISLLDGYYDVQTGCDVAYDDAPRFWNEGMGKEITDVVAWMPLPEFVVRILCI